MTDRVTLLGIRHHGPGSSRMVAAALERVRPEVVLIEGPPEADALTRHVPDLTPPVALLLHDESDPSTAAFWPFASFSPEWQAMTWAARNGVPVRFFDLPAAASLDSEGHGSVDPIGLLAEAAGFDDPERWWEDVVEHSASDPIDLAKAVAEAMASVRAEVSTDVLGEHTLLREAYMRRSLRQSLKDFDGEVAVVCGAWHVPALMPPLPTATSDNALLKGLRRRKISGTWVPWSHGQLAASSGYGAGVDSPGWYAHLWEHHDDVVPRWFAKACSVLRAEDLPASTASAVEAVRLADTLAALRERPSPGLSEVTEAALAVLCGGDRVPLQLVHRKLVVGERLGSVGAEVPRSPLAADLARLRKRLRLPASLEPRQLRLDLRKDTDRERSKLLQHLEVLGVPWGKPDRTSSLGTFAEMWQLEWNPAFEVAVAVAARHGTTVEQAASTVLCTDAEEADRVAVASGILSRAVGCELPAAVEAGRKALDRCAAKATDALELLGAVPSLARTVRYGSVRGTDPELLRVALHGLLARGAVGLPLACRGVDDETGEQALSVVDDAHEAVRLAADEPHQQTWWRALTKLAAEPDAHGLPAGRATRLLWEAGSLDTDAVAVRLHRSVASAFVAGFLRGSATLLAADPRLFGLIDEWLTALHTPDFDDALPLLRRAISEFSPAERRLLGERVTSGAVERVDDEWDDAIAARLVARIRELL
ncbi:hypothetical protein Lesp02_47710 [Lentzea sp. NBRC 105346]|uniref:DUF5682 family protein n=1 Tax=Lentzea sp. NBRC 105346 TaxID=3032205 RepID=UPI0024A071BF|nr:DUF5682 family protein [Lentzea sp. NBRC 105346]GLZ32583.1 hypothetical protein Lesp02_47710 [Lentzea sp. NBRC 105346]